MPEVTVHALLLDFDGVIADTYEAARRHWHEFAERVGLDGPQVFERVWGIRTLDAKRQLAQEHPFDVDAEFERFERISAEDFVGVVAVPGAAALLTALPLTPEGRHRWAIVTGGDGGTTGRILRHLGLPAPDVLLANTVGRGKPHPDGYLGACEALGVLPENTLVVEDAPAGMLAGSAAGATVVGLRTTTREQDFPPGACSYVVDDLSGLAYAGIDAGGGMKFTVG